MSYRNYLILFFSMFTGVFATQGSTKYIDLYLILEDIGPKIVESLERRINEETDFRIIIAPIEHDFNNVCLDFLYLQLPSSMKSFTFYDRTVLNEIEKEFSLQLTDLYHENSGIEIGKMVAANTILTGKFDHIAPWSSYVCGDGRIYSIILSLELVNIETGSIIWNERFENSSSIVAKLILLGLYAFIVFGIGWIFYRILINLDIIG